MPKINKIRLELRVNTQRLYLNLDIMYTPKGQFFYIAVPEAYAQSIPLLSDEKYEELHLHKIYKSKNAADGYIEVIKADTERMAEVWSRSTLQELASLQKHERAVILVYFNRLPQTSGYNTFSETTNREQPTIGLTLGLLYCKETTISEGKPTYSDDRGRHVNVPYRFVETGGVVLDDTPENRSFLEHTHGMLTKLIERMTQFFGTQETLLQLIASNQKLIG